MVAGNRLKILRLRARSGSHTACKIRGGVKLFTSRRTICKAVHHYECVSLCTAQNKEFIRPCKSSGYVLYMEVPWPNPQQSNPVSYKFIGTQPTAFSRSTKHSMKMIGRARRLPSHPQISSPYNQARSQTQRP